MIPVTDIVLAVALPLLVCLIMLLGILLLRGRQLRAFDTIDRQRLNDKCAKLEQRLAAFPKAWDGQQQDTGVSRGEVEDTFRTLQYTMQMYLERWIGSKDPKTDSPARIEGVLFPEPPPEHKFAIGKDTRPFPNPHQYTPTEICTFLEQVYTRTMISHHIMSSILLHAMSFEGDPFQTLLPLGAPDMYGLDRLKNLIRGVDLSWNVRVHISKFGLYYAHKGDTKERLIALFESLFDPYFTKKSPADVAKHRLELEEILDLAIQHGVKVVGQATDKTEYRWGARKDKSIIIRPALHALEYEGEKLIYDTRLQQDVSCRAIWD